MTRRRTHTAGTLLAHAAGVAAWIAFGAALAFVAIHAAAEGLR